MSFHVLAFMLNALRRFMRNDLKKRQKKSCGQSSINKSDKHETYVHAFEIICSSAEARRNGCWVYWSFRFAQFDRGMRRATCRRVGWRFRSVASPQLSSFQPLTPLKYFSTRWQRWQCSVRACSWHDAVRRLNREAVYSGPAVDAEETQSCRGRIYGSGRS